MANTEQNDWVARVLGYRVVAAADSPPASLAEALAAWRAAMETVDAQITALQSALRQIDDDELHEIAEYGLNAVTGGHKVKFTAAAMGAERGGASDRQKLAALIPLFRDHLQNDERVEAVDENPFGVSTSVRTTLISALDQLERSVAE